ncbi:hypothetical protein EDD11_010340, partial [Mortierella claussenii]
MEALEAFEALEELRALEVLEATKGLVLFDRTVRPREASSHFLMNLAAVQLFRSLKDNVIEYVRCARGAFGGTGCRGLGRRGVEGAGVKGGDIEGEGIEDVVAEDWNEVGFEHEGASAGCKADDPDPD